MTPVPQTPYASRSRMIAASAIAVAAIVLLVAGSSSNETTLWVNPGTTTATEIQTAEPSGTTVAPPPARDTTRLTPVQGGEQGFWVVILVMAPLLAIAIIAALSANTNWLWSIVRRPNRNDGSSTSLPVTPLPDRMLEVDEQAIEYAVSNGVPRNAIVDCWMQLERDAVRAGFAQDPTETSTEFMGRVVAASSVEVEPITLLGELYREARFSTHLITDADRKRARESLETLTRSLNEKQMLRS